MSRELLHAVSMTRFTADKGKTVVTGTDGVAAAYDYGHRDGSASVTVRAGAATSAANTSFA